MAWAFLPAVPAFAPAYCDNCVEALRRTVLRPQECVRGSLKGHATKREAGDNAGATKAADLRKVLDPRYTPQVLSAGLRRRLGIYKRETMVC